TRCASPRVSLPACTGSPSASPTPADKERRRSRRASSAHGSVCRQGRKPQGELAYLQAHSHLRSALPTWPVRNMGHVNVPPISRIASALFVMAPAGIKRRHESHLSGLASHTLLHPRLRCSPHGCATPPRSTALGPSQCQQSSP